MSTEQDLVHSLNMSPGLARDLLKLAGGDEQIVYEASDCCVHLDSMKCHIIDARMRKLERKVNDEIQRQNTQREIS